MIKSFDSRQVTSVLDKNISLVDSTPLEIQKSDFGSCVLDGIQQVMAFVIGLDQIPVPLSNEELIEFGDPFSRNILLKGKRPITLQELVDDIASIQGDAALPFMKVFLVAEGGQKKIKEPLFEANERLVLTWQKTRQSTPDLFLSTVPAANNVNTLLQLIAWSEVDEEFHFFERRKGVWFWVGKSSFAFDSRTRGKGPFDGHINGGLVMKELRFPWVHWHSQNATIPREIFGNEEINTNPLFNKIEGAQTLERFVMEGITRWSKARLAKNLKKSSPEDFLSYSRQILKSTSVNLISSSNEFSILENQNLQLPPSFFFDIETIGNCLFLLDPFGDYLPTKKVKIEGARYIREIRKLEMHINSDESNIRIEGDSSFAFTVPERAFEDTKITELLVANDIISVRLAISLSMVDFHNPIHSEKRASMMKYFPAKLTEDNMDNKFVTALIASPKSAIEGTAEFEFLEYWRSSNILLKVQSDLREFVNGIQKAVNHDAGLRGLIILAELRKEFFRVKDLNEFKSTLSKFYVDNDMLSTSISKSGKIG